MPWQIILPFSRHAEAPSEDAPPAETGRDTFDQLLYSFVLLIAGRAFLMEPFVIPTGSMAPTLYGRHKECVCDACDFEYQIGASAEVDEGSSILRPMTRILTSPCPNCRFPNDVKESMAFNGDHILVNKWAFHLDRPRRFDVFVFKYPADASRNYIKRLVGLPNETVRIRGGDLYRVTDAGEEILRMDRPRKRRAAAVLVHDNDHPSPLLEKAGWPERWSGDGWVSDGTSLTLSEATEGPSWLTYTHFVPKPDDWRAIADDRPPAPAPRLISDYCPYNSYTGTGEADLSRQPGPPSVDKVDEGIYWVPDIALEFDLTLDAVGEAGAVVLELREGVHRYRCRIDPATGLASLSTVNVQMDPDEERELAKAATPVVGAGRHSVRFANIDDQLCLWVDERPIDFGDAARYDRRRVDNTLPTQADLSPIRVGLAGASGTASRLRVYRDLYYRPSLPGGARGIGGRTRFQRRLTASLADPDRYADLYSTADERFLTQDIRTGDDEYVAMGDNSPQSNDSRMWGVGRQVVPHENLVGKAFFTYWPHGIPFLNGGRGFTVRPHYEVAFQGNRRLLTKVPNYPRYVFPFSPNFQRMRRIR